LPQRRKELEETMAVQAAAPRPAADAGIRVRPTNGFIGAEIDGIDLRHPLSPPQFEIVHDALVRYEVIVLRDQDITVDQQMAFGALFGELSIHPFSPNLPDKPEVIILDYSEDNPPALTDIWHADETFRETPPLGTLLRAKVVPEVGGDTLFASMTAAYRGLSERMKQHIHGMEALHDFKPWRPLFGPNDRAKLRKLEDDFPNPWHPVVRVHPESGRRVLNVNRQFCVRIKDLKSDESDTLLEFLYRQATIPEYQLRVKWQPNTLVMWDNRSVLHYAAHDYYPARRTMERVTVKGDRPIGVSGPYTPDPVPGNGTVKPKFADGTRPGPRRAFDRY
jgi:taurine dioxygenase